MAASATADGSGDMRGAGLDELGGALGGGLAEDQEIEQRVGAEPGGAVHRDASRLAHRHQSGHGSLGIARGRVQRLAVKIGRDAPHVVVGGRQYRDRLPRHVDVGEDPGGLRNAGQSRMQQCRVEMLQMQQDVVVLWAAAAPLAHLDLDRAADHVTGREVAGIGCIALHETLTLGIGQVAAFAARALGDQAAGAIDAGRMKLDELHVLQRQAGAQRHCVAVAGTDMRLRRRHIGAASASRRQHDDMRTEEVQGAVVQPPGDDPATTPSSMTRSSAKYSTKNSALCLRHC